jgi:PKD repeat protein
MAPLDVSFSASFQLNGGCELAYTQSFDFGDGTPPAAYVGEHTYVNPGTYTWTYTVAVLGGTTCTHTGTVTVCGLACGATVPAKSTVGLAVAFAGSASVTGGCAPAITYDWNFGDGTAHSSAQNPSHTYASAGSYTWTFTVSAGSATCVRTGAITTVNPPVITLMKKVAPPFKIVVTGTNLQSGLRVFIGEAEWTSVMYKKSTKIQLTGGASLKAVVPKGVPKTFRFLNADGGEASTTWSW